MRLQLGFIAWTKVALVPWRKACIGNLVLSDWGLVFGDWLMRVELLACVYSLETKYD